MRANTQACPYPVRPRLFLENFPLSNLPKKPKSKQIPRTNKNLRTRQGQEFFSLKNDPKVVFLETNLGRKFIGSVQLIFFIHIGSRALKFNSIFLDFEEEFFPAWSKKLCFGIKRNSKISYKSRDNIDLTFLQLFLGKLPIKICANSLRDRTRVDEEENKRWGIKKAFEFLDLRTQSTL